MEKLKLTSVKVLDNSYKKFKVKCIETGLSLQKLLNRSIYLYNTNQEFQRTIDETRIPLSGSNHNL